MSSLFSAVLVVYGSLLEVEFHLIYIAPAPVLSRFEGPHDRMVRSVKMHRGVLVLRAVTASHMAAFQAQTKVNPAIAGFQAFFTAPGMRGDRANLVQMSTRRHAATIANFGLVNSLSDT